MGLFQRAIRRPDEPIIPNDNDPASVPPATVGPPSAVPGDPDGVTIVEPTGPAWSPPPITPMPWSGWPDGWQPMWGSMSGYGMIGPLTDTAWMCIDRNASALATMPPYLVNAAPTLNVDWLNNPDPNYYASWEEFCKSLFWDYQMGEAYVLATVRYASGWPARFHVVPGWMVQIELVDGLRRYMLGDLDVTDDLLHIRYTSRTDLAHGVGPLDAGYYRMVAANLLIQYGMKVASGGGVPVGVLNHPEQLSASQAAALQAQWVQARMSTLGEPAVLSGGLTWQQTQLSPADMALSTLLDREERRIAELLGVPSELVGIPTGTDPMTYKNVTMWFDLHWRTGLRPKAQAVMAALSNWALPRGTNVELNRDEYVQPEPLERAQVAQLLHSIVDPVTGQQALTVQEIRTTLRLDNSTPTDLAAGVLR
jgi:HK97 family phage portal protein